MSFFNILESPMHSPLRMSTPVVSFFIFFQQLSNKKLGATTKDYLTILEMGGACLHYGEWIDDYNYRYTPESWLQCQVPVLTGYRLQPLNKRSSAMTFRCTESYDVSTDLFKEQAWSSSLWIWVNSGGLSNDPRQLCWRNRTLLLSRRHCSSWMSGNCRTTRLLWIQ